MKIVVFGADERVGVLEGDRVVDLNRAEAKIPASLAAFIAGGPATLEAARAASARALASAPDGVVRSIADAKLRAPWAHKRIACAGGNYARHAYGMAINRGAKDVTLEGMAKKIRDDGQWGFWKVLDEVAGPGDEIPYPKRTRYFDYEGELAIVIGKRGKDIKADRIAEYVWGVTLAVDWSARDPERNPRPASFNLGKNFDRSGSMGPCIVVGELDPQNVDVETRVDGALRQQYNSKEMVYSFGEILEFLSRDFTFVPGDVIFGGTAAGTAQDSTKPNPDGTRPLDLYLKPGSVVEVSSPAIGTLTSRIV